MSVLIKNGRVVTAVDDYRADVFVDGETVALIGSGLERGIEVAADRIIDAAGKLLLPGGIDPHTHMELPFGGTESSDTFETGTRAAAFGGTTSIVDFAVQPVAPPPSRVSTRGTPRRTATPRSTMRSTWS